MPINLSLITFGTPEGPFVYQGKTLLRFVPRKAVSGTKLLCVAIWYSREPFREPNVADCRDCFPQKCVSVPIVQETTCFPKRFILMGFRGDPFDSPR